MRIPKSIRWLLVALVMCATSIAASAGVFISVNFGPPPLPVYAQPICPGPGYLWTPGYWAWGPNGYFWVPGTWVVAPQPGLLWTPGYWAFGGGVYLWHAGFWGPTVGFYGGINYGFGYTGVGFAGGYWRGGEFFYNRNVTNVNIVNVHNVYNTTVINNNTTVNRVAFNGGPGGIVARPTAVEERAAAEHHIEATSAQLQHENFAKTNRAEWASVNQGKPSIAATARPGEFEHGAVAASHAGAPYRAPEAGNNGAVRPNSSVPRPSMNEHPAVANNNESRGSVPRPPSSGRETGPNRNQNGLRASATPRPEVPRPPSASRPSSTPRAESTPRNETTTRAANNVPRPQSTPRPTSSRSQQPSRQPSEMSRPSTPRSSTPRPQSEPRNQSAPSRESAPHGQEPRPQAQSHSEKPSPERPARGK